MTWVTHAEYIKEYVIMLTFNDGLSKVINLYNELNEGVFRPLKNIDFFKKFHVSANTIEWENGADFAPEYLRSLPDYKI